MFLFYFYFKIYVAFVFIPVHACSYVGVNVCVQVWVLYSIHGLWELNSDNKTWQRMSIPVEPSHYFPQLSIF